MSAGLGSVGQHCGITPPVNAQTGASPLLISIPSCDAQRHVLKSAKHCFRLARHAGWGAGAACTITGDPVPAAGAGTAAAGAAGTAGTCAQSAGARPPIVTIPARYFCHVF